MVVQSDRDWDHEVDEFANRHIEAVLFIAELDCGAGAKKSQSRTTNQQRGCFIDWEMGYRRVMGEVDECPTADA